MSWGSPSGSGPRHLRNVPPGRRPTPRVVLGLPGDPTPPGGKWEWPEECRLGPLEQSIVDGTHRDGEVPCFGCPSLEGCEGRLDDRYEAAAALMGVELVDLVRGGGAYRKCECGSFMMRWRVNLTAWARVWICNSLVKRQVFNSEGTTDTAVDVCHCAHTEPAKGPKRSAGDLHRRGRR